MARAPPASKKSGLKSIESSVTPADARKRLVAVRLRPTRQRITLLQLLLANGDRHVTPDNLWGEAQISGVRLTLATIYNCLNDFTKTGLLKRVVIGPGQVFFDTDASHRHYVYHEASGVLRSVPARGDGLIDLADELGRIDPRRLDFIVRVRAEDTDSKGPGMDASDASRKAETSRGAMPLMEACRIDPAGIGEIRSLPSADIEP